MTINQPFDRATVVRTIALLLACLLLVGFALRVVVAGAEKLNPEVREAFKLKFNNQ